MTSPRPTPEQAYQFAVMLQAGLPPSEAILYFVDLDDSRALAELIRTWTGSSEVRKATLRLMGKSWQDMSLEEKMTHALNHHYSQLAYVLFSTHYGEVGAQDKAKLDSARTAIEAKQAGTAGKTDALTRFFDDINSGRLKLNVPASKVS